MSLERFVLAAAATAFFAACGPDSTQRSASADRHELASGLTVEASPGSVRERNSETPRLWFTVPTASVVVRAGPDDPPEQSFRISNIAPSSEFLLQSARYRTGDEFDRCSDAPNGSVDCPTSDPICDSGRSERSDAAPTTARVSVDLPPCAEVRFGFEWTVDQSKPFRVAVLGAAGDVDRLADVIDRNADAATMMLLTGDYAGSSDREGVSELADALEDRAAPLVVTPGEREVSGSSEGEFTRRFGTLSPTWTVGGVQFLGFPSPRQSLATDGIDALKSRLTGLDRDRPIVALTHTAPFDPAELRDRGFRSRTEASRTVSVLATHRTDLLLAGHLPDRQRAEYGDVDLVVPPKLADGEVLFVELTTRAAGADAKVNLSVEAGAP